MKKIVSFLLALVLTLSLTTNALAAVVSPKTDVTEAAVGQTVKLTVTASGQEPLTGVVCLNYRVYFDPAVFELDAAASAANTKGARLTALKTDEVGSYYAVSLLDPTSEGLDVSGDLYTLVFKVRDGAAVNTKSVLTIAKAHIYTIADGAMQPVDNGAVENSTVTVKIISSAPATVTLGTAKAGANGIKVTWEKAANAATYNVYRKGPGDTYWKVVSAKQSGTSYTDKNVTAGSTYKYTVRGVASDGKTLSPGFNNTGVSATMPKPVTAPANVTLTGAKAVSGGIQVTWQKAAGAAQYRVYRKDATNIKWTALTSSATGTSYVDKTAKAGVTYTYTVRGIAKDGKTLSPGFNNTGVSAVIAPAKVVLVSAKADSAGILVTWQKAAGAHSYQVYRKTAGTGWQRIAKDIHDTEWKDITAAKGTKYIYTVRGVAADGKTLSPGFDATGKTAAVTKDPTTPANVTLGKAVAGKSGITVTWSYAADARTYRVYRKAAGETKWTIVAKNAEGKSWTDKNVTKGVKYTYTVRGVSANGKALSRDCTATVSATAK